ncbi:MAG TPA: collagen-like protein, partial [Pricia sp.]|nr:collagen-like protein [Pricia sp.]
VLGAFLTLFLVSCEGDPGPPGFDGLDGLDGAAFEAAAFEIDVDMQLNTGSNRYEVLLQYPSDITLLPDDVVLIYRLEEVNNGFDVWRQLPQPFFSDTGLLYYNFDFTQNNYGVFLEPEFDATLVTTDLVNGQVFRIVIIPADLGTSAKMDKSNLGSVMSSLGISEKDVQKIQMN